MAAKPKPRMIGRHIVADPAICHVPADIPGHSYPGFRRVRTGEFRNGVGARSYSRLALVEEITFALP
jgi:hypothetical protein